MYYADARGQESFELSDIDSMSDGTLVMGLCTLDGDLSSAQHGAMYRHMLQDAILQGVKRRQNSHPKPDRGRGSSVRNGEVELTSRGRGSSIWTTSGRFSVKSKNDTPFATKRRPTKRPPKPDRPRPHLGRNRVIAYGPVCFPHSGVSRASASVRLMIQRHSARRALRQRFVTRQGFVSVIKMSNVSLIN